MEGEHVRIGLDVGGTKVEGLALGSEGAEVARMRTPTPRGDYEGTIAVIVDVVRALEGEAQGEATVGLGTPGAIDPASGLLKNSNSVALNGRPVAEDVAAALGRPVRIANDADCMALSEAVDGAAAGEDPVFGVIVGTGVGGGVVVGGSLVSGPNAIAGEWGHNPLPWPRADEMPGHGCYCGRTGCIETFLSGPALEREYLARTGVRYSAAEIAERAGGNAAASAALEAYADRMARSLATVMNILDPAVIVLGGGVSRIDALYRTVPELWNRYVFSDDVATRLVPARHGDASGVRGAAWLWGPGEAQAG